MPGTSALISPWTKVNGFYFDDTPEEDHFMYEFKKDMDDKLWESNKPSEMTVVDIDPESKEEYFRILNKMQQMNANNYAFCISPDSPTVIVEDEEDVDKNE